MRHTRRRVAAYFRLEEVRAVLPRGVVPAGAARRGLDADGRRPAGAFARTSRRGLGLIASRPGRRDGGVLGGVSPDTGVWAIPLTLLPRMG